MPDLSKQSFKKLAKEASLQPQEKLQAIKKDSHSLNIGIPREITYQERRVPLSPLSVQMLTNSGHDILLETGAGKFANFRDVEYSEAGARIVHDKEAVYKADIILKVDPPTMDEIALMRPGQIIISALQIAHVQPEYLNMLMRKKITAIAYEYMRDESGTLSIIRAMSEIAGRASVLIAAEFLNNSVHGKGELLGGIPGIHPTEIVVIGAGAVGEYAVSAAIGLGANVTVFDNSLHKLRRLENNLGRRINSSTIIPHVLAKQLAGCDVAIGALRSPEGRSPCVVSEAMVQGMKAQSLIIDVSIDQGGCFETSEVTNHESPIFVKHDVLHYCVPNIASRVSRTASYALSNIFMPILTEMGREGGFESYLWSNSGLRSGVYIFKGTLTNSVLGSRFGIKSRDLDFLLPGNLQ